MRSSSSRKPSVRASNALVETLAWPMVSNAFCARGKGGVSGERAITLEMIRRFLSLVPPPARNRAPPAPTQPPLASAAAETPSADTGDLAPPPPLRPSSPLDDALLLEAH